MRYLIDAWLDIQPPRLRLIDTHSGRVAFQREGESLRQWLQERELSSINFSSSDPGDIDNLIAELTAPQQQSSDEPSSG